MDENKAKQITDYVFKDVFGVGNPFSLEEIRKRFASGPSLRQRTGL